MPLKIIIVEDDASIRTMLEYYFKSMGHQVRAYESGEALCAQPVQGDIALLDVMLPGMDGLEIVRRLRRRTRPGDILCLHDGRGAPGAPARTIAALEILLPQWLAQGFRFATLECYG